MSSGVSSYVESKLAEFGENSRWKMIQEYYKKRLFHQLTEEIKELFESTESLNLNLREIFEKLLGDVSQRINPISFAKIIVRVGEQIAIKSIPNALEFVEQYRLEVVNSTVATIICKSFIATLHIQSNSMILADDEIRYLRPMLETLSGITPAHYAFYDSALQYHKALCDYSSYFNDSLLFFGIQTKETIIFNERLCEKAYFAALSCLLSPSITNIGAIVCNDFIRELLNSSQFQWLIELLEAFNHGDIGKFESMKDIILGNESLRIHYGDLCEKIILMAILNLAFHICVNEEEMTFDMIAMRARIPVVEVERYIIRAISLGIIKGSIDQVNGIVNLTWVKSTFLTNEQIHCLKIKVDKWKEKVNTLATHLQSISSGLYNKI